MKKSVKISQVRRRRRIVINLRPGDSVLVRCRRNNCNR